LTGISRSASAASRTRFRIDRQAIVRLWLARPSSSFCHALRHLRFLTDPSSIGFDAPIAGELDDNWQRHLRTFEPAIARMYAQEHRPLSPRTGAGPNG
jgi:hypothetical protein